MNSTHFYNHDLTEFEKLNTTTESIYDLGDLNVLIILKNGENLTDYLDIENPLDVIYISEDLSRLDCAESYYYLGKLFERQYEDNGPVLARYTDNPLRNVRSIVCQGVGNVDSLYGMFRQLDNVTTISGLDTWDVSQVRNMSNLFVDCGNLRTVHGMSGWDVSNVSNMTWMFQYCENLEDISFLRSWDVSNVEIMRGMFMECRKLKNLEALSDWRLDSIRDLSFMFYNCGEIRDLGPLADWDVSGAETIRGMFQKCSGLKDSNPLSKWDVTKIRNIRDVFKDIKIRPAMKGFEPRKSITCIYCGRHDFVVDGDLICGDCGETVLKAKDMKCPDCGGSEMAYDGALYCKRCGLILYDNNEL